MKLIYPTRSGGNSRVPEAVGTVSRIQVGAVPNENVEFAAFIEFEDGVEWIDPEDIVILT